MTDILNKIGDYLENLALMPQYAQYFYDKFHQVAIIAIFILTAFFIMTIAILVNQSRIDRQIREIKNRLEQVADDKTD